MYFNLVRIFGDVQLVIKETTNPNDFFGQVRTPKEEVYKQIVQDLTDAFAMLPDAPAEKGKAGLPKVLPLRCWVRFILL